MADFSSIIQEINADITTNGVGAITGAKLNQVLRDIVAAVNTAKQDPLTIDATPTEDSTNPVQSGGVFTALANLIADGGLYGGVVGPSDSPTYGDDYRYYYIAMQAGRYVNFNNFEVDSNVLLFFWTGNSWGYKSLWATSQFVSYILGSKADTVYDATQGNLAGLDGYGNLTDSGIAASTVATKTELASKQDTINDLSAIRSGAALGATAIQPSEKGVATGVATLNSQGKIPVSQLPSYVDDVLEYANLAAFPETGESGKIYVALDTNKTYRWSGSAYVEIAQGLALGETSSTAFPGDRGKAIEDKIPSSASSSNKLATASDVSEKYTKPSGGIPKSDLSSDVQQALQKHFKGWYDSESDLPADGRVGDYAYVKGATASDPAAIYAWDASLETPAWVDTERTADTSNVQTFESGEEVNDTYIDDTHLVNPKSGSLPTADDVLQLKAKLDGVTASETKIGYIDGSLITGHYVGSGGSTSGTSTTYDCATFDVGGYKRVRFLGVEVSSTSSNRGCAFYDANGDYLDDTYIRYDVASDATTKAKEYVVEIPDGAKYFKTNVRIGTWVTSQNFYCYLKSGESVGESIAKTEETVEQIKKKTDNLEETNVYTDISSSIMTVDGNLAIAKTSDTISSSSQSYWKMRYFQARQNDWRLRVKVVCSDALSYKIGQVFLVDNVSEIAEEYITTPLVTGIYNNSSSPIDTIVNVPAGKIVVISTTTYHVPNSQSFEYYEVTKTFKFLNDIEQLQEDVSEKVSVQQIEPDYVDSTNPLAIVKETPGYTSIFRTMGVIGGSMASGAIYPGGSPEYSQIQYIARLCGSEGHNFGRGGMSARQWPKSDMIESANEFKANPMQMYIIQLGNNDSAYNSDHPEYVIGEVSQVNGIDGTGIVPDVVNVGSAGTTTAYPNYANTFCGQIGKVLACIRRVSPKAHVFLSTFLGGYGGNQNFAYNQAIRDIYVFLSDSENIPTGDTLKYHLIDYETYGTQYSSYLSNSDTIHKGTVSSSHLMATGYLLWAYEYCTYIDWIIKNNMSNFNDVSAICKKIVYNFDNVTIDSVSVNGVSLNTDYLPNYVPYQGTLVLHLTAPTSINSVEVYDGYGHAGSNITSSTWDSTTQTITISSVEDLITITAKGS